MRIDNEGWRLGCAGWAVEEMGEACTSVDDSSLCSAKMDNAPGLTTQLELDKNARSGGTEKDGTNIRVYNNKRE
jgi:inosine/xanthosine triphosphate pyrophosphatase family protein